MQQNTGTTAPWEASQPLLQAMISRYSSMSPDVTAGQSKAVNALTDATGKIPNFGDASAGAVNNLFNSSTAPQVGMLSNSLSGLKSNLGGMASGAELDPYSTPGFSDAIRTMTQDITDKVKGVYNASGRDPSGAGSFAGSLGRGLTQGIAPTIAAQFNQNNANRIGAANTLFSGEQGTAGAITGQNQIPLANASSAMGMLPQLTSAYTAPAAAGLSAANLAQGLPYANLAQMLAPAMGFAGLGSQTTGNVMGTGNTSGTTNTTGTDIGTSSMTGTGQSTTTQPQSLLSNILGGGMGAAGILSMMGGSGGGMAALAPLLALSDKRAKENVEKVGKLNDGQPVYRYQMKGSPETKIGLLAQNVRKSNPRAVGHVGMGMLGVDYKRATDRSADMERAA